MRSEGFETLDKPRRFVVRVIWAAMTGSILLYTVVAYVIGQNPPDAGAVDVGMLRYVLAGASVALAAAAFVVPNLLFSDEKIAAVMSRDPNLDALATGAQTTTVDPERRDRIAQLEPYEQRLLALGQRAFTPFILRLALHEAIAICGLLLALLSYRPEECLPFTVVAVVLNLVAFPSHDGLHERARRLYRG